MTFWICTYRSIGIERYTNEKYVIISNRMDSGRFESVLKVTSILLYGDHYHILNVNILIPL